MRFPLQPLYLDAYRRIDHNLNVLVASALERKCCEVGKIVGNK